MTWDWVTLVIAGFFACVLADAALAWFFFIRPRIRNRRAIRRRLGI